MNLFFVGCVVAGMISLICFSLFVREEFKGRLTRRSTWKDMSTYHWVLFFGTMLFPIVLFGMLFGLLFTIGS
jgi:MFS superfamily sulfate permease-like transporter